MDAGTHAASLAAELLAFYREPALIRPRYLHGDLPMPEGALVLRMALGRFASEGLDSLGEADRGAVREAALAFVRQVCLWDRASHYQLLCLEPDATPEQVKESYHLLIALIHPDRREDGWPSASASRVNQAYGVLSDAGKRVRYDDQLRKAAHESAVLEGMRAAKTVDEPRPHVHRRRRSSPRRMLARFAVIVGVVAGLFVVQAWWLGQGTSPQYSLLERAIPAAERLRDVLPDPPRFLGSAFTPGEPLPPIEEPRRMASLTSWLPATEARPPAAPVEAAVPAPTPTKATEPAKAPAPPPPPPERAPTPETRAAPSPISVAQAAPPKRLAQAAAAGPAAPSREQVEGLVALLVSYYDAGDADRLVGLFDPDKLGFWSEMRTKSAYADFFGATRDRRLRIDRLDWQVNGRMAQARGEAIVLADYQDGRPRLERRVPVELDIVLHETQPRLARLVLFPAGA